MQVKITQLTSYPIKSCAGVAHQTATIDRLGLTGDRQWMLVDKNGLFLSQRKHPKMALIQPRLTPSGWVVDAPGMNTLAIEPAALAEALTVTVWKNTFTADANHPAADQWFSQFLGIDCRLVRYGEHSHRPIDPDFAQQDDEVSFADGYPILVTHEASLQDLNQQLSTPIDIGRFRSNIVVQSTAGPWQELHWQTLSDQNLRLELVKPCKRCVMTGVEQTTGAQTGTEVLKTLKQQFAHQNHAVFGINAIPRFKQQATLAVGNLLTVA